MTLDQPFGPVAREAMLRACLGRQDLRATDKLLFAALLVHVNGRLGTCFPGIARLAALTGLGYSTIRAARSRLKRAGLLAFRVTGRRVDYLFTPAQSEQPGTNLPAQRWRHNQGIKNPNRPIFRGMAIPDYISTTRRKESGGDDAAKNPNSSASGRYQITDSTYRAYAERLGLKGDKNDPENQEAVMAAYTADSEKALAAAGLPVTDGNLYALHFLGQSGGTKILTAPDDAPAADYVSDAARAANKSVFYRGGKPITVGEFKAWAGKGFGGSSAPVQVAQQAQPQQQPQPAAYDLPWQPSQTQQQVADLYNPDQTGAGMSAVNRLSALFGQIYGQG